MRNPKRCEKILGLLQEHGSVSVDRLADWVNVSTSTIRRDLGWLSERQIVTVQHGHAKFRPHAQRLQIPQAKEEVLSEDDLIRRGMIARYAANMCASGERIIIGCGATTSMMGEYFSQKLLSVHTNSFGLAQRLLSSSWGDVTLTGGPIHRDATMIHSPFDGELSHIYADRIFISPHGICADGLIEKDMLHVDATRRLIGQADGLIVLMDSRQLRVTNGIQSCPLSKVSCVITDSAAPSILTDWMTHAGINVVIVEP